MLAETTMYDTILVPTDGSAEVERAVEYAIDLARVHDATIRAVYVANVASYGGLPMETAWEGISDTLRGEGRDAVSRVEELAGTVPVETAVLEGTPSRVILEEATPETCDLIVMGTHGRGGIDRLLLGSVTERVVRSAQVPVLTVNVGADETDRRPVDTRATLE